MCRGSCLAIPVPFGVSRETSMHLCRQRMRDDEDRNVECDGRAVSDGDRETIDALLVHWELTQGNEDVFADGRNLDAMWIIRRWRQAARRGDGDAYVDLFSGQLVDDETRQHQLMNGYRHRGHRKSMSDPNQA